MHGFENSSSCPHVWDGELIANLSTEPGQYVLLEESHVYERALLDSGYHQISHECALFHLWLDRDLPNWAERKAEVFQWRLKYGCHLCRIFLLHDCNDFDGRIRRFIRLWSRHNIADIPLNLHGLHLICDYCRTDAFFCSASPTASVR